MSATEGKAALHATLRSYIQRGFASGLDEIFAQTHVTIEPWLCGLFCYAVEAGNDKAAEACLRFGDLGSWVVPTEVLAAGLDSKDEAIRAKTHKIIQLMVKYGLPVGAV